MDANLNTEGFSCMICSAVFTRQNNLTRHIKIKHAGNGRPSCRYCCKRLSRTDSMLRHELKCPQKFAVDSKTEENPKSDFQYQMLEGSCSEWRPWEHNPKRRKRSVIYKCNICSKRFIRLDNLSRHHRMVHSSSNKPKCIHCNKPFSRVDAVSRHQLGCLIKRRRNAENASHPETTEKVETIPESQHQQENYVEPSTFRPWEQPNMQPQKPVKSGFECMKVFTRKDNLNRHMKLAHSGDEKPCCRFCSKVLSRRDATERHESICPKNPGKIAVGHLNGEPHRYLSHLERLKMKHKKISSVNKCDTDTQTHHEQRVNETSSGSYR